MYITVAYYYTGTVAGTQCMHNGTTVWGYMKIDLTHSNKLYIYIYIYLI